MAVNYISIIIIITLTFRVSEDQSIAQELTDTSFINSRNRDLLVSARENPDLTINLTHQVLGAAHEINHKKGVADASLVLGTAWFAKYNKGDSSLIYNMQAYELYRELDDSYGKGRACYNLSYVYSLKGDLEESERYSALSLNFFEEAGFSSGMVNAYHVLSFLAKQQNDLRKARGLILQAIEIARSAGDTLSLADVTNSLGNIYKDMALFKMAIDTYFEALHLWELKGDSAGISIAYGSIGLMYYYQKEWGKALEFCFKKLPVSIAKGDLYETSKTYNTIAQIYNSRHEHDSALFYLRWGLQLNNKMNYPPGIATSYHNIASTFLHLSQIDSAYWYINKAITLISGTDDPALAEYFITLGLVYKSRGHFTEALQNLTKAYDLGKEHMLPMLVHDASIHLSGIYSAVNRYDLAYKYLKEYKQLQDSISSDEFLNQVTRMELQYEFDKKQRAAEYAQMEERILNENRISQQTLYVKGLLVLLILGILITLLYLRHNQLRSLYTRMDLEQRLLRAQMNPHFLFNSLCAVQDFILAGKPQQANTFLTKIAKLMRNILENSREEFITLDREIETLRLYLDLQQIRFEKKFDYYITIDEAIDPENISLPPMLTQPCVENSIEHGILHSKEKGLLNIEYKLSNGLMMLEVTDNGIGRKQAVLKTPEKMKKQSLSTILTQQRLDHYRKTLHKRSISYEIIDLYDNGKATGTKVIMMVPYRKIYA